MGGISVRASLPVRWRAKPRTAVSRLDGTLLAGRDRHEHERHRRLHGDGLLSYAVEVDDEAAQLADDIIEFVPQRPSQLQIVTKGCFERAHRTVTGHGDPGSTRPLVRGCGSAARSSRRGLERVPRWPRCCR